jgi:hypothetical protein
MEPHRRGISEADLYFLGVREEHFILQQPLRSDMEFPRSSHACQQSINVLDEVDFQNYLFREISCCNGI